MIAATTPDRQELRALVREFAADRTSVSHARAHLGADWDRAVWAQMGDELGLQALAIPEALGGLGLGNVELAIVLEELGAVLYDGPFLSSLGLAATALLATGDRTLLPGLASGERTAALAFAEPGGPWDGVTAATRWHRVGDQVLLSGVKTLVLDGATADHLVVTASTEQDPADLSLFVVDACFASGLKRRSLPTLDQTRALAEVELVDTPATLLGAESSAGVVLGRTLQVGAILLAAEQVGGAQRCLDDAVAYAKARTQFGRAIGSFQAVKHRCADLLVEVETARSALAYALGALETGGDLAEPASLARAHCSEVFSRAASTSIQVHGGIGFTWEHDAHLYLKRAKSSEVLLGTPAEHRELLARAIGL